MVNRSYHIPAVYGAGPKAEKLREPWEPACPELCRRDDGSGLAPQFGSDTQGFTGVVISGPTYLAGSERARPVTEAVGAGYSTTTTQ